MLKEKWRKLSGRLRNYQSVHPAKLMAPWPSKSLILRHSWNVVQSLTWYMTIGCSRVYRFKDWIAALTRSSLPLNEVPHEGRLFSLSLLLNPIISSLITMQSEYHLCHDLLLLFDFAFFPWILYICVEWCAWRIFGAVINDVLFSYYFNCLLHI